MNSLIPYIRQAGEEACSDSLERRKAGDPEYQRSLRKCQSLFEQICVKLAEEKELIFRLDELQNERAATGENWAYWQGYRDCLTLLKWLEKLPGQ